MFPADYATTFKEVRPCRAQASPDHDLHYVRILADPAAFAPYTKRDAAFPVGAVVLKEEYENEGCKDLVLWTAMRQEAAGYDATTGDWHWQEVGKDRAVTADGVVKRCASCHRAGNPDAPNDQTGYRFTCSWPGG